MSIPGRGYPIRGIPIRGILLFPSEILADVDFTTDDIAFAANAEQPSSADVDFTTDDITFAAIGEQKTADVDFTTEDIVVAANAEQPAAVDGDFTTEDIDLFSSAGQPTDGAISFATDDIQILAIAMQIQFADTRNSILVDDVFVCNLALGRLGEYHIMSLTEPKNKLSQWCQRFYQQTRDEILREFTWNFAANRARLTKLKDTPIFEWAYAYQLPSDFVRLRRLNSWSEDDEFTHWEIEGDRLLTNDDVAEIKYTRRISNVALWDPMATEALSLKLAYKIATPITGSRTIEQQRFQEYQTIVLPRAKRVSAGEGKPIQKTQAAISNLVRSRMA